MHDARFQTNFSNGRGSDGAGGSGDQLAAQVAGIDIGAVTERVTSEQSAARSAPFGGEAAGVKKPRSRGKRPNGKQRQNEAKARATGQGRPGKTGHQ